MAADQTYGPLVYKKDGGNTLVFAAGAQIINDTGASNEWNIRVRFTVAQVNAGATILPAVAGLKYRLIDCSAIAIGGSAGSVTTVDILGTQATAGVKLVSFAQANLTQSTVLYPGITGATVLSDGASFAPNDANTAITIGKTGSNVDTATSIDVSLSFALDA